MAALQIFLFGRFQKVPEMQADSKPEARGPESTRSSCWI